MFVFKYANEQNDFMLIYYYFTCYNQINFSHNHSFPWNNLQRWQVNVCEEEDVTILNDQKCKYLSTKHFD